MAQKSPWKNCVPFGLFVINIPTMAVVVLVLHCLVARKLLVDEELRKRGHKLMLLLSALNTLTLLYPAATALFVHLSAAAPLLFSFLVEVVKLGMRNVMASFSRHLEDLTPGNTPVASAAATKEPHVRTGISRHKAACRPTLSSNPSVMAIWCTQTHAIVTREIAAVLPGMTRRHEVQL